MLLQLGLGSAPWYAANDYFSVHFWVRFLSLCINPTEPQLCSYFGVIIICILNLIGLVGFSILNCILGGQALASVSGGSLSWT